MSTTGTMRIGGPRLRALFGLLALRAPAVVSREALIDGIWDDKPPAAAALTLRTHVTHLRRQLAASASDGLITTRSCGYALDVPAQWVDVCRFEQDVRLAQLALAAGAMPDAVPHLRSALRLWRGEVLADCVTGAWARAEATRLQELWHFATEELLAAQLTLGDDAAVTAELESLVARYPLRERLWELLMRALSRAGRRGDALHAYQRARALLVDELGVEPGPGLRRLEAAILIEDSGQHSLTVPVTRRVRPALPSPLTRLVGRQAELQEVGGLLAKHRLVTLTGVGGCGKTRMAVAAAREVAQGFPDGVWFIDLAPLTQPAQVAAAVAAAIGICEDPLTSAAQTLCENLRSWRCLLVLDNCEHLLDACAALTATLLRSCPSLRVLATSREALSLPGEIIFSVPLLAFPPASVSGGASLELREVRRYDAVRLLLERSTVQTLRHLTDADAPALAAICAAVDGLPLALELVATRTAVLTMTEIAARLNDPSLLRVRRYDQHPHHRVLDASIEWSYELLDATTQARFRQLAVFAGGFTLAAAEAVWQPQQGEPPAVDALSDLVAKSLVVVERQAAGTRYRLLETIRRWAADRLAAFPSEQLTVRDRHAACFLRQAEEASRGLRGASMTQWLERLTADHDNLRTALEWYAGRPDPLPQLRFAVALADYLRLRGQYRQGQTWVRQALARQVPHAEPAVAGAAWGCDAMFAFLLGNYGEAQAAAERALRLHETCHDHAGASRTLRLLSCVARERGDYERSLARLREAAAIPSDSLAATHIGMLSGFTAWLAGDLDKAGRLIDSAVRDYQSIGDIEGVASAQIHLAAIAFYRGRYEQAREITDDALTTFAKLEVKEGISWALNLLGLVELRQGRVASAIGNLRASLDLHLSLGDRWRQASLLESLAEAVLARDEAARAAELLTLAATLRETIGTPVPLIERPDWQRTWALLRERLSEKDLELAAERAVGATVASVLAQIG